MSNYKFYDLELFTSQHESVGTIWLIATLGSKSHHRKITRRELLNLSIPKVCDSLIDPYQQLPLRFLSNLLYGVTLVYKQQTQFCLNDAAIIRTRLSRELHMKSIDKFPIHNYIKQGPIETHTNSHILLNDDETFNIQLGLLLPDFEMFKENEEFANGLDNSYSTKQVPDLENIDDLELNVMDEDVMLDFGDLERGSSRVQSRLITPMPDMDFLNDFGPIIDEPGVTDIANVSAIAPIAEISHTAPVEVKRSVKRRKNGEYWNVLQIDLETVLTTTQLRDNNNSYIANQIQQTLKYKRILNYNIEEFEKYVIEKGYKIDLQVEIEDIEPILPNRDSIEIGRRRRSSSISSIENARRASIVASRDETFQSQGFQFDEMDNIDNFQYDEPELIDIVSNIETIEIDSILESNKQRKLLQNQSPILNFNELIANGSKSDALILFSKLLEKATLNECKLLNKLNGDLQVILY